jgi:hypothetical protein
MMGRLRAAFVMRTVVRAFLARLAQDLMTCIRTHRGSPDLAPTAIASVRRLSGAVTQDHTSPQSLGTVTRGYAVRLFLSPHPFG